MYTAVSRSDGTRSARNFGAVGRALRMRFGLVLLLTFALSFVTGPANTFVFLYAQDFVHQSGDVTGRRWSSVRDSPVLAGSSPGGGSPTASAGARSWSGRRSAIAGFATLILLRVTDPPSSPAMCSASPGGSFLAPAIGSIVNELFPTAVRATVTGWTVAAGVLGAVAGLSTFGALADVGARFSSAAFATFVPAALVSILWFLLPDTRGVELIT